MSWYWWINFSSFCFVLLFVLYCIFLNNLSKVNAMFLLWTYIDTKIISNIIFLILLGSKRFWLVLAGFLFPIPPKVTPHVLPILRLLQILPRILINHVIILHCQTHKILQLLTAPILTPQSLHQKRHILRQQCFTPQVVLLALCRYFPLHLLPNCPLDVSVNVAISEV